jgi:hypothetical protein
VNRAVTSSEDQLVRDVLTKRQSLSADLLQIGANLAERLIESDVKYYTEKELLALEGESTAKMTEQGGVIAHLMAEIAKTGATEAGVAERTATVSAGASAQSGAEASASSAMIIGDAAKAAAGVYAQVAQIPYVGWILAPAAAAAAFAAVASYNSLVGLDVGAANIPTQQAYMLHPQEMVVPANFAQAIRGGQLTLGGPGGGGSGSLSIGNISAIDAKSFLAFINNPVTMRVLANRLTSAQNLNPSYRPSY